MSTRSKGPHLTAHSWPRSRLSSVTGRYPACANALHAWLPTKPAPPVTRIVFIGNSVSTKGALRPFQRRALVSTRRKDSITYHDPAASGTVLGAAAGLKNQ